jgi:hypothetical protein
VALTTVRANSCTGVGAFKYGQVHAYVVFTRLKP